MVERPDISAEVVYATAEQQIVIEVQVPQGSTVREVIEASGVRRKFPEIDIQNNGVGIFGQCVALTRVVTADDRVEIYRPLQADPKEVRRERAASRKRKV